MTTLYTQYTLKAGQPEMGLDGREGISSYVRQVIVDNILNAIYDHLSDEEYTNARIHLESGANSLQVDTSIYHIAESIEE